MSTPLSVPLRTQVARALTEAEQATLYRVADALIPTRGDAPNASGEPGFDAKLAAALDARGDAFEAIVALLADLDPVPGDALFARLSGLAYSDPDAFQALSTVVAGAWLLTDGARSRLGYDRPRVDRAGLEDAVDELSDGLLDPVLARGAARWIR